MRSLVVAFLTFVIGSFSGVWAPEKRACELVRRGHAEAEGLVTHDFTPASCGELLLQAARLPAGARELRKIADSSVPGAQSRCLESVNSVKYLCGAEGCLPRSYLYCSQWSYSLVDDPRYALAHELAQLLDVLHDREQTLCGAITRGESAASVREDFKRWMSEKLIPVSERLRDLTCGLDSA